MKTTSNLLHHESIDATDHYERGDQGSELASLPHDASLSFLFFSLFPFSVLHHATLPHFSLHESRALSLFFEPPEGPLSGMTFPFSQFMGSLVLAVLHHFHFPCALFYPGACPSDSWRVSPSWRHAVHAAATPWDGFFCISPSPLCAVFLLPTHVGRLCICSPDKSTPHGSHPLRCSFFGSPCTTRPWSHSFPALGGDMLTSALQGSLNRSNFRPIHRTAANLSKLIDCLSTLGTQSGLLASSRHGCLLRLWVGWSEAHVLSGVTSYKASDKFEAPRTSYLLHAHPLLSSPQPTTSHPDSRSHRPWPYAACFRFPFLAPAQIPRTRSVCDALMLGGHSTSRHPVFLSVSRPGHVFLKSPPLTPASASPTDRPCSG